MSHEIRDVGCIRDVIAVRRCGKNKCQVFRVKLLTACARIASPERDFYRARGLWVRSRDGSLKILRGHQLLFFQKELNTDTYTTGHIWGTQEVNAGVVKLLVTF